MLSVSKYLYQSMNYQLNYLEIRYIVFCRRFLDLSFNHIRVIEGISTLTNLTDLYFINNKLTVIDGLQALTNLTMLELGSNRLRVSSHFTYVHIHI